MTKCWTNRLASGHARAIGSALVTTAARTALSSALLWAALASGAGAAGPVEVRSDGVTQDSRDAMMKTARDYNLRIGFAEGDGSFLANVQVAIHDTQGATVWSGMVEGPLLFARIPTGSYTVTATSDGRSIRRTVKASEGTAIEYFRWPAR
jgi:hypothetical protein